VEVGVIDSDLAVAATSFTWAVQGAPRVTGASLAGLRARRPRLHMLVTAGRGAPGLRTLSVALPRGLRWASGRVTVARPGGRLVASRARLAAGRLVVSLAGAPRQVVLSAAYPAIVSRPSRRAHGGSQRLSVRVTDATSYTSSLTIKAHTHR
jgi:hypothetical protein